MLTFDVSATHYRKDHIMSWAPSTERRTHILNALAGMMPEFGKDTPDNPEVASAYIQALKAHLSFDGFRGVEYVRLQGALQPIATNLAGTWDGDNYAWEEHVNRAERVIEATFIQWIPA